MNGRRAVNILLCCFALVCFAVGIATAFQAARLGKFANGRKVEGTVYSYEVRLSGGTGSRGYHCFIFCRYEDGAGQVYKTQFQYNYTNASYADAEKYGESLLNRPVTLYLKGGDCISEYEIKNYALYIALSVGTMCAGAAFIGVPLIIRSVKNRLIKSSKPSREDYLI